MPALRGLVTLAFGMLTLLLPQPPVMWLVILFAVYALLGGAVWTAGALHNRRADARWRMPCMLGLLGMGVGILVLVHPAQTSQVLLVLIGAHALATGLLDMAAAQRLRKFIRGERLFALSALASIVFGVAVAASPPTGALVFGPLVGLYALGNGAGLLALALRVRRWAASLLAPQGTVAATA
jgi:uncharacterized membrane protein HdeD (DUF308 family)